MDVTLIHRECAIKVQRTAKMIKAAQSTAGKSQCDKGRKNRKNTIAKKNCPDALVVVGISLYFWCKIGRQAKQKALIKPNITPNVVLFFNENSGIIAKVPKIAKDNAKISNQDGFVLRKIHPRMSK